MSTEYCLNKSSFFITLEANRNSFDTQNLKIEQYLCTI